MTFPKLDTSADRGIDMDGVMVAGQMREIHLRPGVDAQLTDFLCVLGRGSLGCEQGPHGVAQCQQVPQFGCLAGRYGMRLPGAVNHPGERAVWPGLQVSVGFS